MTIVLKTLMLLAISNFFMNLAWYGHLKNHQNSSLWKVIVLSWAIAFFEYCFQVPANRIGSQLFSVYQLKIIQEIMTLLLFVAISFFYLDVKPSWNFLWAGLCLCGAVFFIFTAPS